MPPAHDDRLIFDYLDGELDAAEHAAVERRLLSDAVFAARFARLEGMFHELSALPEAQLVHDLAPGVSRRIAKAGVRAGQIGESTPSTSGAAPAVLPGAPGTIRGWRALRLALVPQIAFSALLLFAAWPWLRAVTSRFLAAAGLEAGSVAEELRSMGAQYAALQDQLMTSARSVLDVSAALPESALGALSWSINAGALPETMPLTLFATIAFALWIAANGALLTPIRSRIRGKRS